MTQTVEDDFLITEDIDLSDESELRRIVAEVETLVNASGKGLSVSVLTTEQWQTVIRRWLPPAAQRGAAEHTHALRDPKDHQHLAVSPSGVRGINEHQPNMCQEIVYWLLRCLPTALGKGPLRAGVEDIVAGLCGRKIGVELYTRHAPQEAALVRGLIAVIIDEFGHSESEWVLLLRRHPDRFFLALRKTKFCHYWLACVKRDPQLAAAISDEADKRGALIDMLRSEDATMKSPFMRVTAEALEDYEAQKQLSTPVST